MRKRRSGRCRYRRIRRQKTSAPACFREQKGHRRGDNSGKWLQK